MNQALIERVFDRHVACVFWGQTGTVRWSRFVFDMDNNVTTRRKILQGSLSAPLVLTVSSAAAAVSSFNACIASGANNQPADSIRIIQTQDQWFRCPVTVWPLYRGGSNNSVGNFYKDNAGQYRNVENGNPPPSGSLTPGTPSTWYRLAYYDIDGTPTGVGWEKTGGYAVSLSCGQSFAVCQP